MNHLSPRLLISAATAFAGLSEENAENEGWSAGAAPGIFDLTRHSLEGAEPAAWDAALVQHCGYWSHYDHRSEQSAWPVIAQPTADGLAEFGIQHRVLKEEPKEGDIFLQYSPSQQRFVRAGVIAQVRDKHRLTETTAYYDIHTIEGNVGPRGELGGLRTLRMARRMAPARGDRALRWADLDPYGVTPHSLVPDPRNVAWARRARMGA